MIIGNGLVASLFKNHDNAETVFFASGVSNSLETDKAQFQREEDLITSSIEGNSDKIFVYFSTCSIYDSSKTQSPYVLHKLKMEQIIASRCAKYLILRISNVVGNGGNPNLLMNYLVRSAKSGEQINVHTKATRNLIDAEDVKNLTLELLEEKNFNKIVNIAYPVNYSIIEILEIIEKHFNLMLNLNLVKAGSGYDIAVGEIEKHFPNKDKEAYLKNILEKYY